MLPAFVGKFCLVTDVDYRRIDFSVGKLRSHKTGFFVTHFAQKQNFVCPHRASFLHNKQNITHCLLILFFFSLYYLLQIKISRDTHYGCLSSSSAVKSIKCLVST